MGYDPGRERRAEQRARMLLRSCIEEDDWAMYRDLGFLRVWGGVGDRGRAEGPGTHAGRGRADAGAPAPDAGGAGGARQVHRTRT